MRFDLLAAAGVSLIVSVIATFALRRLAPRLGLVDRAGRLIIRHNLHLGVGLLANNPGSGVLIGLGLGFLASALVPAGMTPSDNTGPGLKGMNITMLLMGVFLILIGVGIVWAPASIWPYLIAGFLILLGVWFLVRGFHRTT